MLKIKSDEVVNAQELADVTAKYESILNEIARLEKEKKEIEAKENELKKVVSNLMYSTNYKGMLTESIQVIKCAAGKDQCVIDLDAFKEKEPEKYYEVLNKYQKIKKGKGSYLTYTLEK